MEWKIFTRKHGLSPGWLDCTQTRLLIILVTSMLFVLTYFWCMLDENPQPHVREPHRYKPFGISQHQGTLCWKTYLAAFNPFSSNIAQAKRFISHAFLQNGIGIGNLMFIYASLWGISHRNKLIPVLRDNTILHKVFNLEMLPCDQYDVTDCNNYLYGSDQCCLYDNSSETLSVNTTIRNITLWGHFQSFRFFHPDFQADIRRQFQFKSHILDKARAVLQLARNRTADNFRQHKRPIIGVHVRRGDISRSEYKSFGFTVATKEYYERAVKYMKEHGAVDPIYVVCTNDMDWARETFMSPDAFFVRNEGPLVDLAVLTLCDYLVLSVGTYSFFAGYLSNASVVTYYAAYPARGSDLDRAFRREDYWLPEWIPLE